MQLKHIQTLMTPGDTPAKVSAISFAPDHQKLAVCHERTIWLYDDKGEKRDKFSTKPCDSKFGKKSFHVTAIAFSPDSTKLAVAQSDCILFVYKVGTNFGDKKSICNKFIVTSPVTCAIWPQEHNIYFGLACGKVRVANTRTNKSSTVYNVNSYTVSLVANNKQSGLLSSHADGQLVRFVLKEDDVHQSEVNGKLLVHGCPASALAWTPNGYFCGGADRKVVVYGKNGREMQRFDYSKTKGEKELTIAAVSPSGQSVCIGSFDCLRIFNWSARKGAWEESGTKHIQQLYTITALDWKSDGSKLACGTLMGGCELFDCSLKKQLLKNRFELTYTGLSQAIIRDLGGNGKKMALKSLYGHELDDIKILSGRYVIAYTHSTLLLGDMATAKLSELQWRSSGNEKFAFHNDNVAMIANAGELTLVEYGESEPIDTVRTEHVSPHLVSARIKERKSDIKKLAYLIDPKTIAIQDLDTGMMEANLQHDARIDWLELNEKAQKLLFRDKRLRLFVYDIVSERKDTLLSYCSYVQWVPGSDVIVAQGRAQQLSVWYNLDDLERVTYIAVRGDVINIERKSTVTSVIVQEGTANVPYPLDAELIEFGTAIDDGDLNRALDYLESLPSTHQGALTMWKSLAKIALEQENAIHIAIRAHAATGDFAKVRYLQKIEWLQMEHEAEMGQPGYEHSGAQAALAQLNGDLTRAEQLYLENGEADKAVDMYVNLNRWEDAIRITQRMFGDYNPEMVTHMRQRYVQWLTETRQLGVAGAYSEKEGDHERAISYYMEAGLPGKAAKVMLRHSQLQSNGPLMSQVATALVKRELYSSAGELFEAVNQAERAMECYRRGEDFRQAVELARKHYPNRVIELECEWGDYLMRTKQPEAAMAHFIESGKTDKAIEAAIAGQQWKKATQILESTTSPNAELYYKQIAAHYNNTKQFEAAAAMMIKGGDEANAVGMLLDSAKWRQAHEMAKRTMRPDQVDELFIARAEAEAARKQYRTAEELFVLCGKEDQAISMYKRAQHWDEMIELVKHYHPDLLQKSYQAVGKSLADERNYAQAERYFIKGIRGDDWKAAVNMYRACNQWEDAYRCARVHAGDTAEKQLAFLWARSLGGESALKLLNRLGHLNDVIDIAAQNGAFDFAFELARGAGAGSQHKIGDIHEKLAMSLEDEGNYAGAEEHFVKANKHREAVLMYVHAKDWSAAERVAAASDDQNSLQDILIGQASQAFINKEYQKAEAFLLRAEKPEIAVDLYREAGKLEDALRVAKEYAPSMASEIQREYVEAGGPSTSSSSKERGVNF